MVRPDSPSSRLRLREAHRDGGRVCTGHGLSCLQAVGGVLDFPSRVCAGRRMPRSTDLGIRDLALWGWRKLLSAPPRGEALIAKVGPRLGAAAACDLVPKTPSIVPGLKPSEG